MKKRGSIDALLVMAAFADRPVPRLTDMPHLLVIDGERRHVVADLLREPRDRSEQRAARKVRRARKRRRGW